MSVNKGYTRLSPGLVTKILAYRRLGYHSSQIARTLGVSKTTVQVVVKKHLSEEISSCREL